MKTLSQRVEDMLKGTFAWDLLGESGSPEEGREELILAVSTLIIDEVNQIPVRENAVLKADPNAKG